MTRRPKPTDPAQRGLFESPSIVAKGLSESPAYRESSVTSEFLRRRILAAVMGGPAFGFTFDELARKVSSHRTVLRARLDELIQDGTVIVDASSGVVRHRSKGNT